MTAVLAATKDTGSTVAQNKALIERFNRDVIENRQIETFYELVSPDFINHAAPPGMQGFNDTISFFERALWPALQGIKVEILGQVGEGDRIVTHKILHAVQKAEFKGNPSANGPVQLHVIDIFRVANGKLMEHWGMSEMKKL